MTDPKYLGMPNICFSLTDETDPREEEFTKQRLKRGFDDSETWSLDMTIAKFILPRLERFKEITTFYPSEFSSAEEWKIILDKMIKAFNSMLNDEDVYIHGMLSPVVEEGLDLFRKYFTYLWW